MLFGCSCWEVLHTSAHKQRRGKQTHEPPVKISTWCCILMPHNLQGASSTPLVWFVCWPDNLHGNWAEHPHTHAMTGLHNWKNNDNFFWLLQNNLTADQIRSNKNFTFAISDKVSALHFSRASALVFQSRHYELYVSVYLQSRAVNVNMLTHAIYLKSLTRLYNAD